MDALQITLKRYETQSVEIPVSIFTEYWRRMQPSERAIQEAIAHMEADEPFDPDIVRWTFDSAVMVIEAIVTAVKDGREQRCTVGDARIDQSMHDAIGGRLYSEDIVNWLRIWRETPI